MENNEIFSWTYTYGRCYYYFFVANASLGLYSECKFRPQVRLIPCPLVAHLVYEIHKFIQGHVLDIVTVLTPINSYYNGTSHIVKGTSLLRA